MFDGWGWKACFYVFYDFYEWISIPLINAFVKTEKHAKKLKKSGDNEGYEVWMLVASKIEQLKEKKSKK